LSTIECSPTLRRVGWSDRFGTWSLPNGFDQSGEVAVPYQGSDTYAFGYLAVREKAPNASGVYTIYTSQRWLYVGESHDIRQSLFSHLNGLAPCMKRRGPLSFSFEVVPAAQRVTRQQALVEMLVPACNLSTR
jgi:hypothetical protein